MIKQIIPIEIKISVSCTDFSRREISLEAVISADTVLKEVELQVSPLGWLGFRTMCF